MNYKEIPNETIIEYHKRFADGEQYIEINALGEIEEIERSYYWQERAVYNRIKTIIDRYELDEELLYGKNGLVSLLIPFQKAYNNIKNREQEYINRVTTGILCVEDGSVDVDELADEGIYPGKVIIYRQGAQVPNFMFGETLDTSSYLNSTNYILKEMYKIAEEFTSSHA